MLIWGSCFVIPAKAGIQKLGFLGQDSHFRGNDSFKTLLPLFVEKTNGISEKRHGVIKNVKCKM